ncbi:hypothetical protein T02_3225 [Trichinella nativa]|uniref:Uncharacterized protein n=2 Tax=Trichinella TaxID=6333 RepID=A0A0V1L0L7_9BILA|nr:hypothetical protein T02_3225 [Trichinella nativa]
MSNYWAHTWYLFELMGEFTKSTANYKHISRNTEPPGYVCCTLLIVCDRLMLITPICGGKDFSPKLQNFTSYIHLASCP